MKKIVAILASMIVVFTAIFAVIPAQAAENSAPRAAVHCETNAQGEEVCYKEVPAVNAKYGECPQGYEAVPGSDTRCRRETGQAGWVEFNKTVETPAEYGCLSGYDRLGDECQKVITAGFWDHKDAPIVSPETWSCPSKTFSASQEVCPPGYDKHGNQCRKWNWDKMRWDYTAMVTETFGPITVSYEKSADPNKCHKPSPSQLGVPSWASNDYGKLDEWLQALHQPAVYGDCSLLGSGWESDKGRSPTCDEEVPSCKKWMPPVIDTKPLITIKEEVLADCAAPAEEVPGNSTACRTWQETTYDYQDRPIIDPGGCPAGSTLMDEKCQEVVECDDPVVVPTSTPIPPKRARNSCEMIRDWEKDWNSRREGHPDPKLVPGTDPNAYPEKYWDYWRECQNAKNSHTGVPAGSPSGWEAFKAWWNNLSAK